MAFQQIAELTSSSVALTQRLVDLLETNQDVLGLKKIYYGGQNIVPDFPSAAVESMTKERDIVGTHRYKLKLKSQIIIYHGKVQSSTITKKEVETMVELVETFLAEDFTLSGLVLFGYVTQVDPGISNLRGEMVQSSRLIYEALSREGF